MRLSLRSQYAICGMFDLAYHGGDAPIQVRVIGERQKIPGRYLEQIFQRLRKADLVRGKRGPGGGYVLARPPGEIHLAQVIEAVEGPLAESLGSGPPPRERPVPARPDFLWPELASRLERSLAALTLASLCREAAAGALERANADDRMWHI